MLIKQCLQMLSSVSFNEKQRHKLFGSSIVVTVLRPSSELELLCKYGLSFMYILIMMFEKSLHT